MASKVPAKSILKQQSQSPEPTLSDEQKAQAERDRKNLGIALYHANKIQHQKQYQSQILSNIEALLEYPLGPQFTSSEASKFATLIKPFQPSDFDSLVEERRIDGKCGYALCSNAPRSVTLGASAAWKLKGKGASDYCGNDCLRKALYVKTQLSEVPVWEREQDQQPDIVLHEDDRPSTNPTARRTKEWVRQQVANRDELALERGEAARSFRPGQVMTSEVIEKSTTSPASHMALQVTPSSHTAIEGYEPGHGPIEVPSPPMATTDHDRHDPAPAGSSEFHPDNDEEDESWRDLFGNVGKG